MKLYLLIVLFVVTSSIASFSKTILPTQSAQYYIDTEVDGKTYFEKELKLRKNEQTYHLITHGKEGELLINGKWLNAQQIATFLKPQISNLTSQTLHLNIYGCEFAKGKKGLEAVAYLQKALGISVAASNNITGKDGDWVLEVGKPIHALSLKEYEGNLQYGVNDDLDGDGVKNYLDLDDDNDGISDINEGCIGTSANTVSILGTGVASSNIVNNGGQPIDGICAIPDGYNSYDNTALLSYGDKVGTYYWQVTYNVTAGVPIKLNFTYAMSNVDIDHRRNETATWKINSTTIASASAINGVPGGIYATYNNWFIPTSNTLTIRVDWTISNPNNLCSFAPDMSLNGLSIGVANTCIVDTDGDGIANNFDLDSDGDGCPDAVEGGGAFVATNLVTSSIPGGNTGGSYTGIVSYGVSTNLGNTVGNTATTMGIPTVAGTGQTLGTSQDKTQRDITCTICGGTTAPTLSGTNGSICSTATTFNLNTLVTSTAPLGTNLVWFTNNTATGIAYSTPTAATVGTYYAFYFDSANNCYTPASAAVTVINDYDCDGVSDANDLDDDNDGIVDTAECTLTGTYSVYAYNRAATTFSTNVPVQIVGSTTTNVVFDQQAITNNLTYNSTNWELLASNITPNATGDIVVSFVPTASTNGTYLVADAILVTNGVTTVVIDNGDAAYTKSAGWTAQALGYQSDNDYLTTPFTSKTATWTFSGLPQPTSFCDTDGDGIKNEFDLDSDGDGCSDAIEGGAAFTSANLVNSTLPGGNTGGSYNGTSTAPVTSNLGNTVGTTATTMGIPTIAGTGQTVGTSLDKTTLDANCVLCAAGTTAPTITGGVNYNGTATYVATAINTASLTSNGGSFTVTYNKSSITTGADPSTAGLTYPASFTQNFNLTDVFPTDAIASPQPNFIYTFGIVDGATTGGLTQKLLDLKVDPPTGTVLAKNKSWVNTALTGYTTTVDNALKAIYNNTISGTLGVNPLTTPTYIANTSTTLPLNGNLVTSLQYAVNAATQSALVPYFSYNTIKRWAHYNTGSSASTDASGNVNDFKKVWSFDGVKQTRVEHTDNERSTSEIVYAVQAASGISSGFGITNKIAPMDQIVGFNKTIVSKSICTNNTVDLTSLVTSTTPSGASLLWFTNENHIGTAYATPTKATAGTYYAFYYDSANNCYSPVSASVVVTAIPQDCFILQSAKN